MDLPTIGRVWYGRFYVRHTTALPATHVTFAAMRDAAGNGKDLRIGGQNGAPQWNRESDDATLPKQSPTGVSLSRPLATGAWTCVEYRVDGTAGQLQTWIDGTLVTGLLLTRAGRPPAPIRAAAPPNSRRRAVRQAASSAADATRRRSPRRSRRPAPALRR